MAIEIKHQFESPKTDGVDDDLVQPSDWNAPHNIQMASGYFIGRLASGVGPVEEIPLFARTNEWVGEQNYRAKVANHHLVEWHPYQNPDASRFVSYYDGTGRRLRTYGEAGGTTDVQIYHTGSIYCTGEITARSDETTKKDWLSLPDNFVERLADVLSGTYSRMDTGERMVGVGAQSLELLLPEAIDEVDGLKGINYGGAAMAACVALARRVVELEDRLAKLEAR